MTHKSFSAKKATARETPRFDIDGQEFTCHRTIPGAVLVEHLQLISNSDRAIAAGAILGFFEDVMEETEHARFRSFIDDPEREVELDLLGDIYQWLVEQYTNRPTKPSPASEPGPEAIPDTQPVLSGSAV